MKKFKLNALFMSLLLFSALFAGCGDDKTQDPEPGNAPVLKIQTDQPGKLTVSASGGRITLSYQVDHPVGSQLASASSEDSWLHDFENTTAGKITFTADENIEDDLTRTGFVTFSYPGAEDVTVSVEQSVPDKPLLISVTEVTVASVKADILAAYDAKLTFLTGLVKKSDYDAVGSPEKFLENELTKLKAEADEYLFGSLAEYLSFLFDDWDPDGYKLSRENLEIDTDYYIFAYGIDSDGRLTTRLVKKAVRTNALKTIDFRLAATAVEQKSATLTADPDDTQTNYFLGFISAQEYENSFHGSDEEVVAGALSSIRVNIGTDASRLDQVTSKGKTSLPFTGLLPDTEFYALAFGIDKSISACTSLTKVPFTTAKVEITDDCTFAIDIASCNSVLMNIHVVPSRTTTRYYSTIKSTDEVSGKTPGQVADEQIAFENGFNMNWAGDKQIFTGERTLHSRRDIGATHIKPQTSYTVYVFGVDRQGNRTTQVATHTVTTTAVVPSSMTLAIEDITPGAETDPDDWFGGKICNFQFSVTPSTDDEYYYTGIVSASEYDSFADDEAFMREVVRQSGDYIMLNCFMGRNNGALVASPVPFRSSYTYGSEKLVSGTDYYIFAFGYMGDITTGLFKAAATADDGEGGGGWNPFPSGKL